MKEKIKEFFTKSIPFFEDVTVFEDSYEYTIYAMATIDAFDIANFLNSIDEITFEYYDFGLFFIRFKIEDKKLVLRKIKRRMRGYLE